LLETEEKPELSVSITYLMILTFLRIINLFKTNKINMSNMFFIWFIHFFLLTSNRNDDELNYPVCFWQSNYLQQSSCIDDGEIMTPDL